MALSGSLNTSAWYADGNQGTRYYTVSWTATQDIVNNASTISWSLKSAGTYVGDWVAERTLKVTIDGAIVYSKTTRVERYNNVTIASGTVTLGHDSVGARSFNISVEAAVYASAINCTGSQTFTLNTIARKSTLSVANGTLGTAQTLTVTRQATSLTHTITATCGSASTTICTQSSTTSISFTPPIAWSSQNTTGTSVTVVYTITTYSGSTSIGSNSYSVTCSIPASVKPSCTMSISDALGYADTYGGYIKGLSKATIYINPTISYGAYINLYQTVINGTVYTGSVVTSNALNEVGSIPITSTITDTRGRTGSNTAYITVIDYSAPSISKLKVIRCNSNGVENDQGEYVQVTFSAEASPLNDKNTATYTLKYKASSDSTYTTLNLTNYNNTYSVVDGTVIFAADSGKSYDIMFVVQDAFKSISGSTVASTASTVMHFPSSGKGMGIGKVVEKDGYFEVNYPADFYQEAHFQKALTYDIPICGTGYNVDTMLTSGVYYMGTEATNKPEGWNGWLEVKIYGDGNYCYQEYTTYTGNRYYRVREEGVWRPWYGRNPKTLEVNINSYSHTWTRSGSGMYYATITTLANLGLSDKQILGVYISNWGSMTADSLVIPYIQAGYLRVMATTATSPGEFAVAITYM